jgi:cobalt-zinc-cadmium efflux system outer membrane protein
MRTCFTCAVLAAVILQAGAGAQTAALTESAVLERFTSASPRIEAVRAGIDVARADVIAAARWPNPRVTFNREAVAGVSENMLMVAQVLPITGRRGLDVSAAAARVEAGEYRAEDRVRRIRADVRLAFTDVWAAQARERELVTNRDRLNGLAAVLAKREEAGEAAGFDRLRAEREVFDVEATRALAAAVRARAQQILAGYLEPDPNAPAIEVVARAPAAGPIPGVDELMARAESARGELVALARDGDAAGFAERAAERRRVPEPEVVAGTKSSNAAGGDVGGIVSVHLSVPLFDRSQSERAAARARARQAQAEQAALRQTIRAEIAAWRAVLVERRDIADRHRAALSASANAIERIAEVSYEAGERGILELLDAYRSASAARIRQVELDAAVREAEVELEFASGWEMP